jgi:hypothetical protein
MQHDVPTHGEKQDLIVAGLGEKKLTIPITANANDVTASLKEAFLKLIDSGGYEFMHAKPSSRVLNIIAEGNDGYTIEYLKRFVGQGRIYVRAIQSDLDLSPESKKDDQTVILEEICNNCMNIFPMNKLREHMYVCPSKRRDGGQPDGDTFKLR